MRDLAAAKSRREEVRRMRRLIPLLGLAALLVAAGVAYCHEEGAVEKGPARSLDDAVDKLNLHLNEGPPSSRLGRKTDEAIDVTRRKRSTTPRGATSPRRHGCSRPPARRDAARWRRDAGRPAAPRRPGGCRAPNTSEPPHEGEARAASGARSRTSKTWYGRPRRSLLTSQRFRSTTGTTLPGVPLQSRSRIVLRAAEPV